MRRQLHRCLLEEDILQETILCLSLFMIGTGSNYMRTLCTACGNVCDRLQQVFGCMCIVHKQVDAVVESHVDEYARYVENTG